MIHHALLASLVWLAVASGATASEDVLATTRQRVVKVYGAGGIRGLEGYRTGVWIAPERVLTIDGGLFESGDATVVDDAGNRLTGRVEGVDPLTGVAVLAVESGAGASEGPGGRAFGLDGGRSPPPAGLRVWVVTNAFGIASGDEALSVQSGFVAASAVVGPTRGGPLSLNYAPAVLLDCVTSNPGAAGGAVVDADGRLVGVIGSEAISESTGTWVNYALPCETLVEAVARAASSPPRTPELLAPSPLPRLGEYGLWLVSPVVRRTPAYVERVDAGSIAADAGFADDDLIVLVNGRAIGTVDDAESAVIAAEETNGSISLTVLRDDALVELALRPRDAGSE